TEHPDRRGALPGGLDGRVRLRGALRLRVPPGKARRLRLRDGSLRCGLAPQAYDRQREVTLRASRAAMAAGRARRRRCRGLRLRCEEAAPPAPSGAVGAFLPCPCDAAGGPALCGVFRRSSWLWPLHPPLLELGNQICASAPLLDVIEPAGAHVGASKLPILP